MHIINCMFGKGRGGIEQAFIDYCCALKQQGNKVTAIIAPDAAIAENLAQASPDKIIKVGNFGQWDFIATSKLRKIIEKSKPDAIICHGNRAISLMKKADNGKIPVIGLAHNYKIKRLNAVDAAFTITEDLQKIVQSSGQKNSYIIPNMIAVPDNVTATDFSHKDVITIGTLGRFVKKKGFDHFIYAIKAVHDSHPNIKVTIAGDGEEVESLKKLSRELGLAEIIDFSGWIDDKPKFFADTDIFCLPSTHEPFGIVLLEAFASAKPVITTDCEGPSEIATDEKDALIVAKENPQAMADAIIRLINNPHLASNIANQGYKTVKENYDIEVVGQKIQTALGEIINAK